jgi:hypothetical protein
MVDPIPPNMKPPPSEQELEEAGVLSKTKKKLDDTLVTEIKQIIAPT